MSEASDPLPPHVLVFPYPAQGHMIPLLDLAHHLSLRGLSVTILLTPANLPILGSLLSRAPTIRTLVLPFPTHPSLPAGAENLRDVPAGGAASAAMSHALASLRGPILRWARSHPSPPDALISDFFLGWTHALAAELGIPRIAFNSTAALLVSVFHHLWNPDGEQRPPPSSVVSMPGIPGSPSFPYGHLPSLYLRYREGAPEWELMKEGMMANGTSWGTVVNTFRDLEGPYVEHLVGEYGHPRVWAVGPLLPPSPAASQRGGQSSVPAAGVLAWLDSREEAASVVYICFGSQFLLSAQQGAAIAAALERSRVGFVWCVKDTSAMAGNNERRRVVPEGFGERTAGMGMVVEGWAPQVAILSHPAVGAFLTHCGWNSALEGMAAGVPLLAWPMEADQFVNARLLVEEAGVGVWVAEGADSVPDPDKLARALAGSVAAASGGSQEWAAVRARAAEMGRKAAAAVVEGGASGADMDGLIRELTGLRHAKSGKGGRRRVSE
uniref:Glycosyltransferase n=1 Tax=Anthurium amnicola TaxID=1678845 RepID=A0A1D1YY48_9ARAE